MTLSSDGIHGFVGVQAAFFASVGLALALTGGPWQLVVPAGMSVVAFLVVCAGLLVSFWPLFDRLHPSHEES